MSESDNAMGIAPQEVELAALVENPLEDIGPWAKAAVTLEPMSEWTPAEWAAWITYQLAQPQSVEGHQRLTLLQDALSRYTRTAEQFAAWWRKQADAT